MKYKILGIALFIATIGTIAGYPRLQAGQIESSVQQHITVAQRPVVDVVFVLDTTGSMSGLIDAAKEKIWSIATTMASAQPTPEIRIGLVGYRDRGDAYVTKTVDLSSDLDSVYAALMDFEAGGGGDTPESVNKALYDAVHNMSWSHKDQAYQTIFLVGDAPPHMDYTEVQYPAIIASANEKGIVINTIQCGNLPMTVGPWTTIASLGKGSFFQVEQSGSAVAYATPFDEEIASLSAKLDATRVYFGTDDDREKARIKVAATEKVQGVASTSSLARRGIFNAADGGRDNMLGENELVEAVTSGEVKLEELDQSVLPENMKPMAPEEQAAYIGKMSDERDALKERIQSLADMRRDFLTDKVEEAGGHEDSLDRQFYETIRSQGSRAGLEYKDGPAY